MQFKRSVVFLFLSIVLGSLGGWAQCVTPPDWASHQVREADRDRNRNGVEDPIENMDPNAVINVVLALNACPAAEDLDRFGQVGTVGFVGTYLSVVQLSGVTAAQAVALGADPRVAMVEVEQNGQTVLNTSVRAIRARASVDYSPFTVQDKYPWIDGFGVNIAILDTGVDDGLHESFPPAFAGYNAVTNTEGDPNDLHGHGTHMAGVALGRGRIRQPGDLRGVAPGAGLVDIKVCRTLAECDQTTMMRAIERCITRRFDWDIQVMYIGIAFSGRSDGRDSLSQAVNSAVANGIVVVVPVLKNDLHMIGPMAAADQAITVGATDDAKSVWRNDDYVLSASARGPRLSDRDPVFDDELKPDVVAPGRLIIAPIYNSTNLYGYKSGPSVSAAHVAGLAALILQAYPFLTPAQVKQLIIDSAWRFYTPAWHPDAGWGLVDAYNAVP